jgi:hypothetical protein
MSARDTFHVTLVPYARDTLRQQVRSFADGNLETFLFNKPSADSSVI